MGSHKGLPWRLNKKQREHTCAGGKTRPSPCSEAGVALPSHGQGNVLLGEAHTGDGPRCGITRHCPHRDALVLADALLDGRILAS
jgi:hypothetical protein